MRVLVTRPEPGCSATAARLTSLGHDPIKLPLLKFTATSDPLPQQKFAAIAFTSSNSIAALDQRKDLASLLNLPAFAVSSRTAETARSAGFTTVHDAKGTVGTLADLILAAKLNGPLLYPAARHRAGDLELLLERGGQTAETLAVYEMQPVAGDIGPPDHADIALFYSRRTAEVFISMPARPAIGACLCLSDGIAAVMRAARIGAVHIARTPTDDAMFDALLSISSNDRKSE